MKSTIYEIATWLEDTNWNLLSPNRAIFSALCGIISNYDEDKQKKVLWEDIYSNMKILEHLTKTEETLFENFMDVAPSVLVCTHTPWSMQTIVWDIHGFDDIGLKQIPIYTNEQRKKSLQEFWKKENCRKRLIAEKLRIEFFPTTPEFKESHYAHMDKNIWLTKLL